jgi:hypothetical protein
MRAVILALICAIMASPAGGSGDVAAEAFWSDLITHHITVVNGVSEIRRHGTGLVMAGLINR